jgi:hypothetical protein
MVKINRGELKRRRRLQGRVVAGEPADMVGATGRLTGSTRRGDALPLAGKHVTIVAIEPDRHGGKRVGVEFKSRSSYSNSSGYAEVPLCDVTFGPRETIANTRDYYDPYKQAVRIVDESSMTTLPQGRITPELINPVVPSKPVAKSEHPGLAAVEKRLAVAMKRLEIARREMNLARSESTRRVVIPAYMRELANAVSCVNQRDQHARTAELQALPFRLMPYEAPAPEKPRPVLKRGKPCPPLHDVWRLWSVFTKPERDAAAEHARSVRAAFIRRTKVVKEEKTSQLVGHRTMARTNFLKAVVPSKSFELAETKVVAGKRTLHRRWGIK